MLIAIAIWEGWVSGGVGILYAIGLQLVHQEVTVKMVDYKIKEQ